MGNIDSNIKHNKIKNTGIIWELLVRQLTADILNEKESFIKGIIKEFFNKNTELYKELHLYKVLLDSKFKNSSSAYNLIDETLKYIDKLDYKKLGKEKYNLIKHLKENYNIKKFFKTNLPEYTTLASIYKLFKFKKNENIKPAVGEVSMLKETVTNHILNDNDVKKKEYNRIMEQVKKNNYVNNKMVFKVMIENFNKKYSKLNENQKNILKCFIENPTNSNILRNKIQESLDNCFDNINNSKRFIDNKAMKIKIKHVLDNMKKVRDKTNNKIIHDEIITSTLLFEELNSEINKLKENK